MDFLNPKKNSMFMAKTKATITPILQRRNLHWTHLLMLLQMIGTKNIKSI